VKARSLDEAAREASTCTRCPTLAQGRTKVVYGVGHPNADLMFIGEGPGKHEDQQGEPFVGDAGQLLNTMLCEIGIRREEVYITNVVKCRPTKVVKSRPPSNRRPYAGEIEACAPWLAEQVGLIDPKLIVPLGNVATRTILGDRKVAIGLVHGQRFVWKGRTVIPTYHPAHILYSGGHKSPKMKALREDFATIRAALDSGGCPTHRRTSGCPADWAHAT